MSEHVLIIGAGIAGLTAARLLLDEGLVVSVLEARNRTGGRICTRNGSLIEEGAEFMHGEQPITNRLLEESGTGKVLLTGRRYQVWDGKFGESDLFGNGWSDLLEALKSLKEDIDMAQFLQQNFPRDRHADLHRKIQAFAEGYDGATLNQVSALALREEWSRNDEDHQYRIEGGYSRLIDFLERSVRASGGEVKLSSPVQHIAWSRGRVEVHFGPNVVTGSRVVITVPVGVMQKGAITFSPAIPEYSDAYRNIGFGGVVKMFATFRTPFWESQGRRVSDMAFLFSDAPIPTWWTSDRSSARLTGWLAGPRVNAHLDRDVLRSRALTSLAYVMDCTEEQIASELRHWDLINWAADPFACGAYAYPTTKTAAALKVLQEPLEETLYFAGEGLYHGSAIGTVEAALDSGEGCARRLLSALKDEARP